MWSSCSWQNTTEEGHTGRLAPAASTPWRQTSVCLDPNPNSINNSSSSPTDTTEVSLASANILCQQRAHLAAPDALFLDKRPGGTWYNVRSLTAKQSTLPSCEPRYKCLMIFNDTGCALNWKSNQCFETPTRFNLSAPESNSALNLILDMRSNDIQTLSSALISLVVFIVFSCCVSQFSKNKFSISSALLVSSKWFSLSFNIVFWYGLKRNITINFQWIEMHNSCPPCL